MSLLELPPELIVHIASFLHPSAVVDFALTSRACFVCGGDALAHQKDNAKRYRVISDIKPLTIPLLMRTIYSDPDVAWYIRSFEFWGTRLNFTQWTKYRLNDFEYDDTWLVPAVDEDVNNELPGTKLPEKLDSDFWTEPECCYFRDYLDSRSLNPSQKDASAMFEKIMQGHDEVLKAMLLAHCPRLESLKFVMDEEGVSYVVETRFQHTRHS